MQSVAEQVAAARVQQLQPDSQEEKVAASNKGIEEKSGGLYSDQQNIDVECEKLLRNTKKQVKRMMEEAVTKKFIHEDSSSIISLCVAVDACLSHGLKRRALGLFKTSSSTALIQKVSKNCKSAQEVLDIVEDEERNLSSEQRQKNAAAASGAGGRSTATGSQADSRGRQPVKKVVASNLDVRKRNKWIKVALIDKKLVSIVEHLAENAGTYYEPEALMANYLCAQIFTSLLVGPSALEFSRSKTNDSYQYDDPSADELLKRHKLANPIACLCSKQQVDRVSERARPELFNGGSLYLEDGSLPHHKLSRSATETMQRRNRTRLQTNSYNASPARMLRYEGAGGPALRHASDDSTLAVADKERRSPSPNRCASNQLVSQSSRSDTRFRRPLALKTNTNRGTIITDCHHYSCQEISEHQQHRTRGYSFLCSSSSVGVPAAQSAIAATSPSYNASTGAANNDATTGNRGNFHHEDWSPRMLHETLHQNSKSNLLYAKNNVLLETQPNETMAGYLSLHQTSSDLILKWIPNQMINGTRTSSAHGADQLQCEAPQQAAGETSATPKSPGDLPSPICGSTAVQSSYLDLVVSLSVSRIVLLHCQFGKYNFEALTEHGSGSDYPTAPEENPISETSSASSSNKRSHTQETLILVEADGIQRAPFKFPKGGLRLFLSCLESGLSPDKYLDPAIKYDRATDGSLDPLQSPLAPGCGGLDLPTAPDSGSGSRLDSLLKRLPSLKRSRRIANAEPTTPTSTAESGSGSPCDKLASSSTTDHYVYRIVSANQPEWPLCTPPHSALSIECGSSGSTNSSPNQLRFSSAATGNNKQQVAANDASGGGGQKFRWTLSRLARFSARYTANSAGSSTSTISSSTAQNGGGSPRDLSLNQTVTNDDGIESINSIGGDDEIESPAGLDTTTLSGDRSLPNKNQNLLPKSRDNSRELARIEAKLYDMKQSASKEILALRTQSIQTLCDSMRKQIVARAFYGWLAYCRKARIIRTHLVKLIHPDDKCWLFYEDDDDDDARLAEELELGLTRDRWEELLRNERQLDEEQLRVEVSRLVYYGGVASSDIRPEVWPYLLGHYAFTDGIEEKSAKDAKARDCYESCGHDWIKIERVVKQRDNELLAANMAKASRDAMHKAAASGGRTISETATSDEVSTLTNTNNDNDNAHIDELESALDDELASDINEEPPSAAEHDDIETKTIDKTADTATTTTIRTRKTSSSTKSASKRRRKRRPRLESTGSVGSDASLTDQYGNNVHRIDKDVQRCDRNFWYFKDTRNLEKLRNIMCTYVWKHLDVGYVQGMCDLAAPFLVIFDDETMAYNCFSQLMKRMESNFPHGCAMDQHFESLKHLIQILDPKLFDILQSNGDYTHFYFCYRWLLLDFKRELAYEDIYKVWETIWSARVVVTDHFVVFMALAMVRYYRDIIIENNMDFTDTIRFFNEMAERHDAKGITALARECIVELKNLIKTMDLL